VTEARALGNKMENHKRNGRIQDQNQSLKLETHLQTQKGQLMFQICKENFRISRRLLRLDRQWMKGKILIERILTMILLLHHQIRAS
jgi:hypothetical protein